ncbi:ATP-binding protein [Delftia tsuruhatensis]
MRVQQILVNLLGNAVKFTERGHVLLRVRYEQGVLQLDVHDTGIGIAAEKIHRIFDPFAQADASTTRRFGGTGLGTTISRQLAELMGGSIQLHSTVGVGTVFEVRLPLPVGESPLSERGRPAAACRRCTSWPWTMCPRTWSCCRSTSPARTTRWCWPTTVPRRCAACRRRSRLSTWC